MLHSSSSPNKSTFWCQSFHRQALSTTAVVLCRGSAEPVKGQPLHVLLDLDSSVCMLDDASKLIDNSQPPSSEIPSGHIFTFEDVLAEFNGDFSSIIEKIEAQSVNNGTDIPELGQTGSLSSWFDCALKEAGFEDTHSIGGGATTTASSDIKNVCEETSGSSESRTRRSRNALESLSTKHRNADTDEVEPDLTDERKKRRMSSNRASAQRSRKRKQDRLDQLEVLTAQLRLENASLLQKTKNLMQLAKKLDAEKVSLGKMVEGLTLELKETRKLPSVTSKQSERDYVEVVQLPSGMNLKLKKEEQRGLTETFPAACQTVHEKGDLRMVQSLAEELILPANDGILVQEPSNCNSFNFEALDSNISLDHAMSDMVDERWFSHFC